MYLRYRYKEIQAHILHHPLNDTLLVGTAYPAEMMIEQVMASQVREAFGELAAAR
jgi:hypothetical protein